MSDSLGFCLVGCGMIARFHVKALADVPGTRIAALVDTVPGAPERLIEGTGIAAVPCYADVADAVKQNDVDVVVVCTPSGAHAEPAVVAAEAGKHVVVEKPLEVTPERCDRIIAACERGGAKLCTIFPSRFVDANATLKAAVGAGRFGRLTLGETTCKWWRSQEYYDKGGWRGTWKLDGGGALMNQAIHNVDLLLWMMGPVTQVMAFTDRLAHERIEVEDTAVACLRFASGALGVIQATTSVHPGYPKTIAIHGTRGSAVVEQEDVLRWDFDPPTADDAAVKAKYAAKVGASGGASDPAAISHAYHARQLADFVESIRTGRAPRVDGREGRKAVATICAIYESAKTGRAVDVAG